jgi:ribosomal protein S18 acetylase RimI-like enzyme
MRTEAFRHVFSRFLDEAATVAGTDAYAPERFRQLLSEMPTEVAVEDGIPVGFCTVRLRETGEVELLWLYVRLDRLKRGVGSLLAGRAEELAAKRYPGASKLVVVTAVPEYNQAFYERLGYAILGEEMVGFPTATVPVLKLGKELCGRRG